MENKLYQVQCTENGDIIERNLSLEEAKITIRKFEEEDISEGIYTPDFYEIKEQTN